MGRLFLEFLKIDVAVLISGIQFDAFDVLAVIKIDVLLLIPGIQSDVIALLSFAILFPANAGVANSLKKVHAICRVQIFGLRVLFCWG